MKKILLAVLFTALFAGFSHAGEGLSVWEKFSEAIADTDLIAGTDTSDTTQSAEGSSKALTAAQLKSYVLSGLEATDDVSFGSVTATGSGGLKAGVQSVTQGALVLYTNVNPYALGILPAASPTGTYSLRFPPGAPGGANYLMNFDADGTGGWTDPDTLGGDDLGAAAFSDVVGLWTTCTDGYLKFDGSCSTPSGTTTIVQTVDITGVGESTVVPSEVAVGDALALKQNVSAMEYVDVDGTTIEKTGTGASGDPFVLGVKSGVFQATLTNPIVRADLDTTPADDDTVPPSSGALYDHTTAGTIHVTKLKDTFVIPTTAIAANTCVATAGYQDVATGAATGDAVIGSFASAMSGVAGYGALATDGLKIGAVAGTDVIQFEVCNTTAAEITPGAMSIIWQIIK